MAQSPELFSWSRLAKGGTTEHDNARAEALELARALAAQTIVLEHDAVIEELPDRIRAIAETIWPSSPLQGYQLHSSVGAWAVAKVAWGWAPSGHVGLRHEPLGRDGLIEDLLEHGVDRDRAMAIVGDWQKIEGGFVPDPMGLDVSKVAGLAECSLTREERRRSLSQVAYSARCLARLASTINVLSVLRAVLPVLPPESLGPKVLTGSFALALHRPDRALQLIGDRHESIAVHTIAELALTLLSLSRGQTPLLGNDGPMVVPATESDTDDVSKGSGGQEDSDGDDVLEIVEERVDHGAHGGASAAFAPASLPRVPRWDSGEAVEAQALESWSARLRSMYGPMAKRGSLLGLRLPQATATVLAVGVPPASASVDKPLDALFPPVRGALRTVINALSAKGPSDEAVKQSGDLRWALLRARALARIVEGDLEAAVSAVAEMPQGSAPEHTWAQDRLRRYRRNVRARAEEARTLASGLISDLGHQLGRTIAGTVPSQHKAERTR